MYYFDVEVNVLPTMTLKFVDLFAGLGGFHLALNRLGYHCVFASEIDDDLRDLYTKNFGMRPEGNIYDVKATDVPDHDILCAGFPCQPFSKAGSQQGFEYPEQGAVCFKVLEIIKKRKPSYLIFENVPNFEWHDGGGTWEKMRNLLEGEGYDVEMHNLSPHHFRIPQIRNRIYIVGAKKDLNGLNDFSWPEAETDVKTSIEDVLDDNPKEARKLSERVQLCIEVWQDFLGRIPKTAKLPSFPIWSMEFGATYPYESTTPTRLTLKELARYRGSHGRRLIGRTRVEVNALLPSHAINGGIRFPRWKRLFIKQNRGFYEEHKASLKGWIDQIADFPSSFQKFEWNCQGDEKRILSEYVLHVRPSGLRVKRRSTAPSLVAMTETQVPIIGWEQRYITPTECKRLQSMEELKYLPERPVKAYKALGNAINVRVAELVVGRLVGSSAT